MYPGRKNALFTEEGIRAAIQSGLEDIEAGHRPAVIYRPPYKPFKKYPKYTGIMALYVHYLYVLGKIGQRQYPPRMTPQLRQEVMKADRYREQFDFLRENGIATQGDAAALLARTEETLATLMKQRTILNVRKKKRRKLYAALADVEALAPAKALYEDGLSGMEAEFARYMEAVAVLEGCSIPRERLCICCYHVVLKLLTWTQDSQTPYIGLLLFPGLFFFAAELYILHTAYSLFAPVISLEEVGRHSTLLILQVMGLAALLCTLYAYRQLCRGFQAQAELQSLTQAAHEQKVYIAEAQARYEQSQFGDRSQYLLQYEDFAGREFVEMQRENPLGQALREKLAALPGVDYVTAYSLTCVEIPAISAIPGNSEHEPFVVRGISQEDMTAMYGGDAILEGTADYRQLLDGDGILICPAGSALKEIYRTGYQVGDTVTLSCYNGREKTYTVMGIVQGAFHYKSLEMVSFAL